jgi:hypothetical protein
MKQTRDLEKFYDKIRVYQNDLHRKNQKKIRVGLKINIFLPLVFLIISFITQSSKLVFLVLWIVSLFGIAFYLLYVEFTDVKLQQKMNEFGAAVEQAGKDYSPSGIANYCYELTKVFNQFYHDYSILNEPDEQKKAVRLMLAKNVAKIIKNSMALLGIEVPERM